jgi:RNA polymerase sigma-70 factor (ECF subfamily)
VFERPERAELDRRDRDAGWVAAVRAGDRTAFEAIFDAYAEPLLAFAYARVRSREVAEEIVQDLFLNLWTRRVGWVVARSLKTYLFQAVHNRVLNYRRDARPAADVPLEAFPSRESTDAAVRQAELRRAIDRAIAALPERNRLVFLLVRQHQLSYREVGDILGITEKTVESHMLRAFNALRAALTEWEDGSA